MKMMELKKQIKAFFDEYDEIRKKYEKLMKNYIDE